MNEYHWPGNVRELENIVTRASVLATGSPVTADELRPWLIAPRPASLAAPSFPAMAPSAHGSPFANAISTAPAASASAAPVGLSLVDMERKLIEATLEQFGGHRAKTAEALGIGLRTLSGKLKTYGYAPRAKPAARGLIVRPPADSRQPRKEPGSMLSDIMRSSTIPMLEQVANFSESRHTVLAGNLANIDTPGYHTRDLDPKQFQARLTAAITQRDRGNQATATLLPAFAPPGFVSPGFTPRVEQASFAGSYDPVAHVATDLNSILYHDDNNRSLEQEVSAMTDNETQHGMALSILTSQLKLIEAAVSERCVSAAALEEIPEPMFFCRGRNEPCSRPTMSALRLWWRSAHGSTP